MAKAEVESPKSEVGEAKAAGKGSGRLGVVPLLLLLFVGFGLFASVASPVFAGKFNRAVSVGDVGKPFTDLIGTDDKPHSLAEYLADAKGVVLVFTCNHCPVAAGYKDRLLALAREFQPQQVRFVAVSCSLGEADSLAAMKERAEQKKYPFPYLHDPSQQSGRDYGARVTPEVFVLNAKGRIVYLGAIDDSWNDAENVQHAYLRDALAALVAGRKLETTETRPRGCPIAYE